MEASLMRLNLFNRTCHNISIFWIYRTVTDILSSHKKRMERKVWGYKTMGHYSCWTKDFDTRLIPAGYPEL
jgi:hypothetical protein